MKFRTVQLSIICLLALILAGCGAERGRNDTGMEDKPPITNDRRPDGIETGAAADDINKPDAAALFMPSAAADGGYYYMTSGAGELTDGREGRHLMYLDYASRQEVYLCGDPSCAHNTADCTSVFPIDEFGLRPSILVMGDKVYLLFKEPDMDGSVSMGQGGGSGGAESVPAVLYEMNADGTERDKIFTFEPNITVEDFTAGDGEGLYFITKRVSAVMGEGNTWFSSTDRNLVRLDISTGELSTICSMDFGDDIVWDVTGCFGRELILSGIDFGRAITIQDRDDRNIYDDADDVFATLDVDAGELHEFYRVKHPKSRSWELDGGTLYYAVDGSGEILAVSISNGKERVLCETPHDQLWGTVGGRLYTWEYDDEAYYFIDPATGEISRCGLTNRTVGGTVKIVAEAGDEVLVIYDCDAVIKSDGSYSASQYYYGLISKSDLYAGVGNYLPIKMIEKGM